MRCSFTIILMLVVVMPVHTQSNWHPLPGAPHTGSRHDDICFTDPMHGWVANGSGEVWKTTDMGNHWSRVLFQPSRYFRCIGFADSLHGWLGSLVADGPDTSNVLFTTTDGGVNWQTIELPSPKPIGICGLWVADAIHVYGVGQYAGAPRFVRSTDGGFSWTCRDMSAFARGLIDVYFFHPDSGFIVGNKGSARNGVVLFTPDRGQTWVERYATTNAGGYGWKLAFPTRQIGYVSFELSTLARAVALKTTDGGMSWSEKSVTTGNTDIQGIGFVSPERGWFGGWNNSSTGTTMYATTDGGAVWQPSGAMLNLNRIRVLNDTLAFAVGETVYRYGSPPTSAGDFAAAPAVTFTLDQNFPNPFNPVTTISFSLVHGGHVTLRVFNSLGQQVATLVEGRQAPGTHRVSFNASHLAGGAYFYRLSVDDRTVTREMVLLK